MSYGIVNADQIGTSVAGSSLGAGNATLMKNRILNGNMVIDQRNAGASGTGTNVYTVDRWNYSASQTGKLTWQQNAGSVTPPAGFSNYLGFTSSSAYSIGASDYFFVYQPIEGFNTADLGFGTANAKTVTLSFQVYSSLTGTFGGALKNGANSLAYPFTYSIPVANTWTTISVTIAGPTSGTWVGATNGVGLFVQFGLGAGSSFSGTAGSWQSGNLISATGATSVVGTSGATFYITGVQLEVGSIATGYEYRLYNQELSACQRYYQLTNNFSGSGATSSAAAGLCFWSQMRANPTLGLQGAYSLTDGYALDYTQSSASIAVNATGAINNVGAYTLLSNLSSVTNGRPMYSRFGNTNQITLSAEL